MFPFRRNAEAHSAGTLALAVSTALLSAALFPSCQKAESASEPAAPTATASKSQPSQNDEKPARALIDKARELLSREGEGHNQRAREVAELTVAALEKVPPKGSLSALTASELFLLRAKALFVLKDYPAGHWALGSAEMWSTRLDPPPLILQGEIQLTHAYSYFEERDPDQTKLHGLQAVKLASQAGVEAASLECEALLLMGDSATKENEKKSKFVVQAEYRQLFAVARRYDYPRSVWEMAYSTLDKIGRVDDAEMTELMGTIPFSVFDRSVDRNDVDQAFREQAEQAEQQVSSPNPPVSVDPKAEATAKVGDMKSDFRACYELALKETPRLEGRMFLSLYLSVSGHVRRVSGRSLELPEAVTSCVIERAFVGEFDPPEGGSQRINIPLRFTPSE